MAKDNAVQTCRVGLVYWYIPGIGIMFPWIVCTRSAVILIASCVTHGRQQPGLNDLVHIFKLESVLLHLLLVSIVFLPWMYVCVFFTLNRSFCPCTYVKQHDERTLEVYTFAYYCTQNLRCADNMWDTVESSCSFYC